MTNRHGVITLTTNDHHLCPNPDMVVDTSSLGPLWRAGVRCLNCNWNSIPENDSAIPSENEEYST